MPDPRHVTTLTEAVAILKKFEREKNVTVCNPWMFGDQDGCAVPVEMSAGLFPGTAEASPDHLPVFVTCWDPTASDLRAHPGTVGLAAVFDRWAFVRGDYIERPLRDRAYALLVRGRRAARLVPLTVPA